MMAVDQAKLMREAARGAHAQFHQFTLLQSRAAANAHFYFFEGPEDPGFYIGHLVKFLGDGEYYEFVCNGREPVIKARELCARDGRASDRTLFFLDKDLTDILHGVSEFPANTYQTLSYSFENNIVCSRVMRRFWSERLRLSVDDARFQTALKNFEILHASFIKKIRLYMALMLLAQGVGNRPVIKLNFNNISPEKIWFFDLNSNAVKWAPGAWRYFAAASAFDTLGGGVTISLVKHVYRRYLKALEFKRYVRGKTELWFFVRYLALISRSLSDKSRAKASGMPRATPGEIINGATCLDLLCGLTPCPDDLDVFLANFFGPAH